MEWKQRRQDMVNGYEKNQESWWVHKILKRLAGQSCLTWQHATLLNFSWCTDKILLTRRYSVKVYGRRSSRKPTSLENLFRTRPAVDTVRQWITDRLLPETDRQTDRQTDRRRQTNRQTYQSGWYQRRAWGLGGQQQTFCCEELWRHSHRERRRRWCVQSWSRWPRQWHHHKCRSSDWWRGGRWSAVFHSPDETH